MFNKNFLVSLKGNEVMSIRQIDNKNKVTVSDSWNYLHSDNRVLKRVFSMELRVVGEKILIMKSIYHFILICL